MKETRCQHFIHAGDVFPYPHCSMESMWHSPSKWKSSSFSTHRVYSCKLGALNVPVPSEFVSTSCGVCAIEWELRCVFFDTSGKEHPWCWSILPQGVNLDLHPIFAVHIGDLQGHRWTYSGVGSNEACRVAFGMISRMSVSSTQTGVVGLNNSRAAREILSNLDRYDDPCILTRCGHFDCVWKTCNLLVSILRWVFPALAAPRSYAWWGEKPGFREPIDFLIRHLNRPLPLPVCRNSVRLLREYWGDWRQLLCEEGTLQFLVRRCCGKTTSNLPYFSMYLQPEDWFFWTLTAKFSIISPPALFQAPTSLYTCEPYHFSSSPVTKECQMNFWKTAGVLRYFFRSLTANCRVICHCPINVVVHRHEHGSSLKTFRLRPELLHCLLDFFEAAALQCGQWKSHHSNTKGSPWRLSSSLYCWVWVLAATCRIGIISHLSTNAQHGIWEDTHLGREFLVESCNKVHNCQVFTSNLVLCRL